MSDEELIPITVTFYMTKKAKELLDEIVRDSGQKLKNKARDIARTKQHEKVTKEDVEEAWKELYG